jgi:hypothetical protein
MLSNISYEELLDWEAFYSIEPFPEVIDQYEHARLLALIANANRDPEKRSMPFEVSDFQIDFWSDQSTDNQVLDSQPQVIHVAYMVNAMFGGKVIKRSEIIQ